MGIKQAWETDERKMEFRKWKKNWEEYKKRMRNKIREKNIATQDNLRKVCRKQRQNAWVGL